MWLAECMDTKLKTYLHAFILLGCLSTQESFNTQKGMENIRIQSFSK